MGKKIKFMDEMASIRMKNLPKSQFLKKKIFFFATW
jgi:hypothetical protein